MNRFASLKDARTRAAEPAAVDPDPTPPATQDATAPPPAPPKPPRKPGKRQDPDYDQVTAYIPKSLNHRVKTALLARGRERDFSGVVAELLETWLREFPGTRQPD